MHNVLCSVSASEQLTLMIGDARGAFLQGKRITRQLYFRLPKNTGDFKLTGIAPGSLLRCEKTIYGTNDAARQWYLALKEILESLGWKALTFEKMLLPNFMMHPGIALH